MFTHQSVHADKLRHRVHARLSGCEISSVCHTVVVGKDIVEVMGALQNPFHRLCRTVLLPVGMFRANDIDSRMALQRINKALVTVF